MEVDLSGFKEELNLELINILKYWTENCIDIDHGGFFGKIDSANNVIKSASKGAVLNARILWTFSAAYNFNKEQSCLDVAHRAFEYLINHFYDHQNGGLIWEVNYKGDPLNTRKQIYAQGFGIYGFSEYYKASNNQNSLNYAIELFKAIERYSFDPEHGGYLEALDQEWKSLEDMRLSEKDGNYPKSMNTHLHILEPYTNLYRVWKNKKLKSKIKSLIRTFLDHIIDEETNHFHLFFEKNWDVKSSIVSYGHDIEGAWLLTEAAKVIEDQILLSEVQQAAIKMTDATINEGMDTDMSLYYELDQSKNHLDKDKHWWPQAEAMVGLVNAYQISGEEKYLLKSIKAWDFIKGNIIDHERGEWYWKVDEHDIPDNKEDKAGFWKCPYHNSRACLEVILRI